MARNLEEGHVPWEIDGDLDTVGPHTFGGRLDSAFTAHPKICPRTGEMIGFGYGMAPPYLTYHRVSADGELVQGSEIDIPAPVMMHDFNVTDSRVVFMDLPVVFDLDRAMAGTMPFAFEPDNGARLGVMARDGDNDSATSGSITLNTNDGDIDIDFDLETGLASIDGGSNAFFTLPRPVASSSGKCRRITDLSEAASIHARPSSEYVSALYESV